MQHVVYQLTDAKVHAQPTAEDYRSPDPTPRFLLQWATGAIAVGKRKHDTDDDDNSAYCANLFVLFTYSNISKKCHVK